MFRLHRRITEDEFDDNDPESPLAEKMVSAGILREWQSIDFKGRSLRQYSFYNLCDIPSSVIIFQLVRCAFINSFHLLLTPWKHFFPFFPI